MHLDDTLVPAPKKARVEIIPLIDVIFFLLATFVLFTLSLNKIASLDVVLPAGTSTLADPDSPVVTVLLTRAAAAEAATEDAEGAEGGEAAGGTTED